MTDDLVKRLREMRGPNVWEAADRIEELEKENKYLEEKDTDQVRWIDSYLRDDMRSEEKLKKANGRIEELEAALRKIDAATISHVDGRDLLDQIHPRHMLDIRRRVDGKEDWFEADWLSDLRDARNAARVVLGENKDD